ncbi:hypothetical protein [Convivina praedatoris]|uniref:Uncharacterized protein n=1 Tax=Convivina praedatoris TaxID=2880963 RepID=A0ABM9D319_9LACO|nr:hypothetical protein [Convivina sp. LMG 32447]CAH1855693.1 hypothetical protein R077815_01259 [Convivina sp. LMG 32447]CAH1856721.1 hypothetical protein R078138_01412 [Convivina sp. LMG 32447]CAH1856785.1 hypothetical protein LMG032447_01371 [Convivina sp. LMG 32447]
MINQLLTESIVTVDSDKPPVFVHILLLLLLIVLIDIITYRHLRNELAKKNKELNAIHNYINQLEPNLAHYRNLRHDCKNMLTSIDLTLNKDLAPEIHQLSAKLLNNLKHKYTIKNSLALHQIQIPEIRSLILMNWYAASKAGINFEIGIMTDYYSSHFNRSSDFHQMLNALIGHCLTLVAGQPSPTVGIGFMRVKNHEKIIFTVTIERNHDCNSRFNSYIDRYLRQHPEVTLLTEHRSHKLFYIIEAGDQL